MRRRDVVFVHPSDELYGADRILLQSIEALPPEITAEVWLPDDVQYPRRLLTAELQRRGVAVRRLPLPIARRSHLSIRGVLKMALRWCAACSLLARYRPRLVYLNTSATVLLAPIARVVGATVLMHLHESWSDGERRLLGPTARAVHYIVAVSEAVAQQLPAALRQRTSVVHNGVVDLGLRTHDVDRDTIVYLLASRWNAWKGHDLLLRAWNSVSRPETRLVILGGPPPSGQAFDVEGHVSLMRRRGDVEVVGEVKDILPWLERADCVLVPSVKPDPLPTIAIEAASVGRAVIASASGGLPEIVESGVTGLLVPTGDEQAWVEVLSRLDREQLHSMGLAARRRFEECFTVDRYHVRIERLLASLLADSRGGTSEGAR